MDRAGGLPITAYLGALVALALTAAFVAVLAVVIWLPPRPPDVMRADVVAEHFQAGYDYALVEGAPLPRDGMAWQVQRGAPARRGASPHLGALREHLAAGLSLNPQQVQVGAANIVRNEVLVFRVRDLEEMRHEREQAAEEARDAVRESARMQREIARNAESEAEIEALQAEMENARQARREALQALRDAREAGANVIVEGNTITIDVPTEAEIEAHSRGHARSFEFHVADPPEPPQAAIAPLATARQGPVASPDPARTPDAPLPPMFAPAPAGVLLLSGFEIGAQLPDGRWLVMRQGRNWAELSWIGRAALIIAGALAVLSLLAVLFARRLTRPIRNFADAVQAVGVDPRNEPVREEGPRELRGAARAVNSMQARLRALIADRTKTLAAVAHDMRSPLMRLRLAAENVAPEQRERIAKEIGEVEALVASFIAFARDDPAEEARVRLDLSALLQSIADDNAESGRNVAFEGEERVVVTGQSLGLKRLFNNLVDNALKYGTRACIVLMREGGQVVVEISDDGPGVPAEQRESVFEPFVRLDNGEARSGAGLGLPAARSIARAHGGDVAIVDAEQGALLRVTLPG